MYEESIFHQGEQIEDDNLNMENAYVGSAGSPSELAEKELHERIKQGNENVLSGKSAKFST